MRRIFEVLFTVCFLMSPLALVACPEENQGPLEKTGEKVDEAADEIGEGAEDVADEVDEAVE